MGFIDACLLSLLCAISTAAVSLHAYHHSDAHHDTLSICAPLYDVHHVLSDTRVGRPVWYAVSYVCGDF